MSRMIWLDAIGPDDRPRVGGKAYVLGRLRQAGFDVPDGFVVPADLGDLTETAAAWRRLATPSAAVRSSSGAEDGDEASFAGQYATFLDVRGEAAVTAA